MATAISFQYDVLLAHDFDEAVALLGGNEKIRLAYIETSSDIQTSIQQIYRFGRLGMEVVALVRPPCPQPVLDAYDKGRLQDILEFPIDLIKFYFTTQDIMSRFARHEEARPCPASILTQEEVLYILNTYRTHGITAKAVNS